MATIGPNLGLTYEWNLGANNWHTGMDANLKNLDTLVQANVKGFLTAPPGSPSVGDTYLTGNGCTGAWSGYNQKIARWNGTSWEFITPKTGWHAFDNSTGQIFVKYATGWISQVFADIINSSQVLSDTVLANTSVTVNGTGGKFKWYTDVYLSRVGTSSVRLSSDGGTGAANLQIYGSLGVVETFACAPKSYSGNQSLSSIKATYLRYTGTGGNTWTLPGASGNGQILIIDNNGSGAPLTISAYYGDTIAGSASTSLSAGNVIRLIDAGAGLWRII